MLTKDDIERNLSVINVPHAHSFVLDLRGPNRDRARELMRLALLGLAVDESGVTADDVARVRLHPRDGFTPGRAVTRSNKMLDALQEALREDVQ